MKRWLLHIWLTGVLGILAASCSQVIDDPVTGDCVMEKEKVMIRFTIALDSPKVASRTWNGYDQDDNIDEEDELLGSENENYINPATVQVWIYDLNGVLIGQLKDLTVTRDDKSEGMHVYDLVGGFEVNSDFITDNKLSFKLMVFANCEPISNMNNLEYLTFTDPSTTTTTTGKGIPMWGIATYQNANVYNTVTLAQNNPLTTPIYMLRSMAKIEVTLDSSMTGYTLEGATLSKAMNSGYVLPTLKDAAGAAKTLANLTATTQLGVDEVFHPVEETTSNITSDASFTASKNTCVIYVPEYDNNTAEDLVINLTGLKKGDEAVSGKSFKHGNYNNDTGAFVSKLNVIRNHYYKYTVKMNEGSQLLLTCEVQPWNVDEENIQFTDEVSVHQKMQWTGAHITPNTTDGSILYINGSINATTAATVTFQIDTPIGATWYASFEGDKDAFAFLDNQGNEVTSVTGEVGTLATLKIVTTEEHVAEMKSVSLMIVVRTMDGRTIMVNKDLMPEPLKTKDYYQIRQNLSI